MTNDEVRMTSASSSFLPVFRHSCFVIVSSFVLRHSSFGNTASFYYGNASTLSFSDLPYHRFACGSEPVLLPASLPGSTFTKIPAGKSVVCREARMDLARNLKTETVSRLYPTQAWLVQAAQPVADAVKLMREKKVGCVLVCEQRRIVGIFTERDLLRRVLSQGKPLDTPMHECMTPDPVTVNPKDPISCAIKRMQKGGYRHLPVVIDDRPVGILSVKRIVHYLVEHFPTMVYNLPPHPQPIQPKREGA
jgi:predicted transcriptional regulator